MDICIVTFNRKEYLERCVWSIIASTSVPYRIFVIDDISTDGTIGWLDEMLERGLIYKVFKNTKKGGTAKNFNAIIKQTDGEWVTIANDDMWFHKGWDVMVNKTAKEFDDCGIVSFFDFQRINVDDGVEKTNSYAWRVFRTGLGASYINRKSFNKAGGFKLPKGKTMGYFATDFCNNMRDCGVKRNRVYHLAEPLATHMDFPQCKLNERERYGKYGKERYYQKNGRFKLS